MPAKPQPKLEIRVPISPTERYFRQVRYLLESLRTFGGPVGQNAHCVVLVGADEAPRDLASELAWVSDYSVEFQWVDRERFRTMSYYATGSQRFRVKSNADVVAFFDADLFVAGDLGDVVREAHHAQRLLGFIAHVSPFFKEPVCHIPSYQWWNWIFEEAGLSKPLLACRHTGWGLVDASPMHRRCPPYFNYGFVLAPRTHVERIAETIDEDLAAVERVLETIYKAQIALTIAITRHETPWAPLSINYNLPLHVDVDRLRQLNPDPDGANTPADVKIFHCIGNRNVGEINPSHFESADTLRELLGRNDLSPHAVACQRKLAIVHEKIEGRRDGSRADRGRLEQPQGA